MILHRQDLLILLLYYLGFSRVRNLLFRLQRKPVTRVVMFHDIPPEAVNFFKANLTFLKRRTNVVSLDEYFSGRLSSQKINLVITFDDGFKSWITFAVPVLKELALPAIFFITSGFVGLSKKDEVEFMRSKLFVTQRMEGTPEGLGVDDVKRIVAEGFSIGGHTLNHRNLGALRDNTQAKCEIAEDKISLEKITGTSIEYFAYPSGAFRNSEIDLTRVLLESGYKGALTTVPGFNTALTDSFLLHRDLTRAMMGGQTFKARVYGNYDAVRFLKKRLFRIFK